jgi:hypothetical protein
MEEVPKPEYILSQVEKDGVDEILRKLSSPSEDEPTKQYAASTLAFQSFYPWCDSKSKSFQIYFSQKEGPKVIIEALKGTTHIELQNALMSACWNYGETTENQLELIQAGALPIIISFVKSTDEETSDRALGGLWGMLEIEALLDMIAEEKVPEVIVQRLKIPQNGIHFYLQQRYRLFGCMQCAAVNEKCRQQMLPAVDQLVPVLKNESNFRPSEITPQSRLGFCHIAVFLAYMATDESVRNTPKKDEIIDAIATFTRFNTPETIGAAEEGQGYVWQYLTAYLPLVETDIVQIRRFGAFAMAYLSRSARTRTKMIEQKVLDRIQMLTYSLDSVTNFHATKALSNFKTRLVPSLKTWCYWRLVETHGVKQCRKILAEHYVDY